MLSKMLTMTAVVALFIGAASGPSSAADRAPQSREQITLSFAPLVRQTAPAVVNIFTRTVVHERRISPLFDDPFFQRFFGGRLGLGGTRERVKNSLGSGVIVSADGLLVTNNHVIEGADEIRVVLADRREFPAQIVGVDERTDLAVLRVSAPEELPYLRFSDSDDLEVGDLVLAIGNPFGVGQTVTSGIVSGVARTQVGVADIGSFIQTDAAINPGNSGGALIGMDGQLVGINTAIFSRSGGSLGIGFAVPANMARFVIDNIASGGKVVRPWLGAFGQPVTSEIAEALGLRRPAGVLVDRIWPSGAAEEAGLQQGDIVTEVDGRPVNSPAEIDFRIGSRPVGGVSTLGVIRENRELSLKIELRPAPEVPPRNVIRIDVAGPMLGAVVANMSPALNEEEGLGDLTPGVVILGVADGSPAQRLGLSRGDRVVAVNQRKTPNVKSLLNTLSTGAAPWTFVFGRDGRRINLRVN
ncbi:MAG: Do family serine endopeptidase [Rhodospirillales bacterium]